MAAKIFLFTRRQSNPRVSGPSPKASQLSSLWMLEKTAVRRPSRWRPRPDPAGTGVAEVEAICFTA